MKIEAKAWQLKQGDRFHVGSRGPIRHAKCVRTYAGTKTFVDCGITTVTYLLVLKPRQKVTIYE